MFETTNQKKRLHTRDVEFTHWGNFPVPSGMHRSIDKSQVLALIVGQSAS
jgi:hypothetical protein